MKSESFGPQEDLGTDAAFRTPAIATVNMLKQNKKKKKGGVIEKDEEDHHE